MNREFKFRAWLENAKTMEYPEKTWKMFLWAEDESQPIKIMQFTGMFDRFGNEIYEGDIVRLEDIDVKITFEDGSFQMITSDTQGRSPALQERLKRFEVIGNIYEN